MEYTCFSWLVCWGKWKLLGGQGCPRSTQLLPNTSHRGSWPISEHEGLPALDISQMKSAFFLLKSTRRTLPVLALLFWVSLIKNFLRQPLTWAWVHLWCEALRMEYVGRRGGERRKEMYKSSLWTYLKITLYYYSSCFRYGLEFERKISLKEFHLVIIFLI